jgi:tRNA (mo5U34)-methyltransferase
VTAKNAISFARRVEELAWYHTIELPGGVVTRGRYDTRSAIKRIPMPDRLDGARCLDVGTADGFWAFEMERRGASEVVAIDISSPAEGDWPKHVSDTTRRQAFAGHRRACFELAAEALGSRTQRRELNVYELSAEELGSFDFVFLGALLIHLRDPAAALASVRQVTSGDFLCLEPVSLSLSLLSPRPTARLRGLHQPLWWLPNVRALRRLVEGAGFELLQVSRPFLVRYGECNRPRSPEFGRVRELGYRFLRQPFGAPHAAVLARAG